MHCPLYCRLTFCTFRMLSETCTPHACAEAHTAADQLYGFMQDPQHDETFEVLRQVRQPCVRMYTCTYVTLRHMTHVRVRA